MVVASAGPFAPNSRQITMPAPHHSIFYTPDALPDAKPTASKHWKQSAEGTSHNGKRRCAYSISPVGWKLRWVIDDVVRVAEILLQLLLQQLLLILQLTGLLNTSATTTTTMMIMIIITIIKTTRLSVSAMEVGVAGWAWSTHAYCKKADLNWKL